MYLVYVHFVEYPLYFLLFFVIVGLFAGFSSFDARSYKKEILEFLKKEWENREKCSK